jgi:hypothetical protein
MTAIHVTKHELSKVARNGIQRLLQALSMRFAGGSHGGQERRKASIERCGLAAKIRSRITKFSQEIGRCHPPPFDSGDPDSPKTKKDNGVPGLEFDREPAPRKSMDEIGKKRRVIKDQNRILCADIEVDEPEGVRIAASFEY